MRKSDFNLKLAKIKALISCAITCISIQCLCNVNPCTSYFHDVQLERVVVVSIIFVSKHRLWYYTVGTYNLCNEQYYERYYNL